MSDKSDERNERNERNRKLQERLIRFAQKVVQLCKKLPRNSINQRLIPQLVTSSNSMSANYAEACAAGSKADFLNKLRIVFKETNETRSHLRVIYTANENFAKEITEIGLETVEFIKIFRTILSKFSG